MIDHDMTLIDLTYLLIASEAKMLKSIGQAKVFEGSIYQTSMDIGNGNEDSPERLSLPKGEKFVVAKKFDHKRKANFEIVPCTIPKESTCFYFQEKGQWMRSCRIYLKDRKDDKVKLYESTSSIFTI